MDSSTANPATLGKASKQLVRRLLSVGGNRLALLAVEVQEERERLALDLQLALGSAVFALLCGLTGSAAIAVFFWKSAPVITLLILTAIHGAIAAFLFFQLNDRLRQWRALSASLDQLQKDRQCLEELIP